MKNIYLLFLFLVVLIGVGCSGSKAYTKRAKQLQEAGLNDEAARFYLIALQRNPKNVDAKIGLKLTGQKQIESTLNQFYQAYSVDNYKDAVYKYQEALHYQERYGYFVNLEIPPYYNDYYLEVLEKYLDFRYQKAGDLLYEEKFDEANVIYDEIVKLNPDYKDARELAVQSTVEPLYRKGVSAFEAKKYRTCYDIMSSVLQQKTMYKDAIDYKDRSLELGRITVAVLDFDKNTYVPASLPARIQSDVVSELTQISNPFIKVLDRSNMEDLIREQQLNVLSTSAGTSAIRTGELLGANMLIKGKVLTYNATGGQVKAYSRQGFEEYKVKKYNKDTKRYYYETHYRRVTYTEYVGSASVYIEVQYQIISAETGEVVRSEIVRKESSDHVNYATYNGNIKKLYQGKYSGKGTEFQKGDVLYNSYSQKNKLHRLFKTNKTQLKSEEQLTKESVMFVTQRIINGIDTYNPDEN